MGVGEGVTVGFEVGEGVTTGVPSPSFEGDAVMTVSGNSFSFGGITLMEGRMMPTVTVPAAAMRSIDFLSHEPVRFGLLSSSPGAERLNSSGGAANSFAPSF
ncbi:MAG: hypothetical protein II872_05110 [Clostridia bacterium]|nr:hypothetical protein [Clostridia bacterium]